MERLERSTYKQSFHSDPEDSGERFNFQSSMAIEGSDSIFHPI